jgi:DNA-binding phage protein
MPLPQTLDLICKTLRLTTADMAKISGVSQCFITDTIAGRGNPSLKTHLTCCGHSGYQLELSPRGLTNVLNKACKTD